MGKPPKSLPVLAKIEQELDPFNYEIFDKDNPRSVYNLVSPTVRESMDTVPKEFLVMSEPELERELKPDLVTCRLRLAFWIEYEHAQKHGNSEMRSYMLHCGACTKPYFYHVVLRDPRRLAWILTPPSDYLLAMKEILDQGTKQLRKIVMGNVVDSHGNINTKAAEQVIKAMAMVDMKLFGGAVVRTESKVLSKTLHMHQTLAPPPPNDTGQDIEAVQKRIEELKQELELVPVEVVSVDET